MENKYLVIVLVAIAAIIVVAVGLFATGMLNGDSSAPTTTTDFKTDFMEGTFEDSQEMVIFITELNTSFHAVKFLSENECERYFRYNSRLLFDNRAADIMKKLDRLGEF